MLEEEMYQTQYILEKRENMGLTQKEFAQILGMNNNGERTVRGWELGEHKPTPSKWKIIQSLKDTSPFKTDSSKKSSFRFIDLFAGIGGIRIPFQELGGECVFSSEWDKFSQKTYAANFGELPSGDIVQIPSASIEDHDILLGGFPCQAFSQAGLKKGFFDSRGTMFFEIQRILVGKRPKAFVLENVKQLRGHNKGETLKSIIDILEGRSEHDIPDDVPLSEEARKALSEKLNYTVDVKVLRAGDFGVPQNRERVFIVGFDRNYFGDVHIDDIFQWAVPPKTETRVGDILEDSELVDDKYTISEKLYAGHIRRKKEHLRKGNGFGYSVFKAQDKYTNTISARYYKDGSEILINQEDLGKRPRKLTPRECARLQGFPEEFIVDAVSTAQAYRQFGNSVCVPVIRALAKQVVNTLHEASQQQAVAAE